jgi:penicillin V acylase-like amidase (Ntn superfamily)
MGLGMGMRGIPGDFTAASRFVRLFYFKQFAQIEEPPKTYNEHFALVNALLNTVFIPYGSMGDVSRLNSFFV